MNRIARWLPLWFARWAALRLEPTSDERAAAFAIARERDKAAPRTANGDCADCGIPFPYFHTVDCPVANRLRLPTPPQSGMEWDAIKANEFYAYQKQVLA